MSKRWLHEHHSDHYVKQARGAGYASRAAYKLLELNDKDRFLKSGMTVVDLGAAPGGWSQVANDVVGKGGKVFALDILPMDPITGVTIIQGDFTEDVILEQLLTTIDGQQVDLVISDMAPNISGNKHIDQPRTLHLIELALDCAYKILKPNGVFLAKVFQGAGVDALMKDMQSYFKIVKVRKPKASRARSSEFYIFATGFIGYNG